MMNVAALTRCACIVFEGWMGFYADGLDRRFGGEVNEVRNEERRIVGWANVWGRALVFVHIFLYYIPTSCPGWWVHWGRGPCVPGFRHGLSCGCPLSTSLRFANRCKELQKEERRGQGDGSLSV